MSALNVNVGDKSPGNRTKRNRFQRRACGQQLPAHNYLYIKGTRSNVLFIARVKRIESALTHA